MVHKPTLIIHGASSYTATELLAYLDTHPQGDQFEFILAGRTEAKLESKNDGLSTRREVVAVDLSDERSVEQLVEKGDVVVNLAGMSSLLWGVTRWSFKLNKKARSDCSMLKRSSPSALGRGSIISI